MSCCGKSSKAWNGGEGRVLSAPVQPGVVFFQYLGPTGMTVIGPVTGRTYRFPVTGAITATEPRDAPSLAAVPHLAIVRKP